MSVSQRLTLSLIDSPHQAIVRLRQGRKLLFRCIVDGQEVQLVLNRLGDESAFDADCQVFPATTEPDRSLDIGWRLDGLTTDNKYFIALIHAKSIGLWALRHLVVNDLPLGHPIECQDLSKEQLAALAATSVARMPPLQLASSDKRFEGFTVHLEQVTFTQARHGNGKDCKFRGRLDNGLRVVGSQFALGYCSVQFNAS